MGRTNIQSLRRFSSIQYSSEKRIRETFDEQISGERYNAYRLL